MKEKTKVLFVLGGPGCGKGTQCNFIAKKFNFSHLSAGDLLREEVNKQGELSEEINKHIGNGSIVPGEITAKLLNNAIKADSERAVFIIDGFPRNIMNLEAWNNLEDNNLDNVGVLHIKCDQDVMLDRVLNRGKDSDRIDDNKEIFNKRIKVYNEETQTVLDHFNSENRVYDVLGNCSIEECHEEAIKVVERLGLDKFQEKKENETYIRRNIDPYFHPLLSYLVKNKPNCLLEAIEFWSQNEGKAIKDSLKESGDIK